MTKKHLAEDAMSKPEFVFQYFWRDRACAFKPKSKKSDFRPSYTVLLLPLSFDKDWAELRDSKVGPAL